MIVHNNAVTNKKQREYIQTSNLNPSELARQFTTTNKTVNKWKARDYCHDKSSRPNTIHYALSESDQELVIALRKAVWLPADDLVDILKPFIPNLGHSNCSRTLVRHNVNKIPQQEKEHIKKFKEYEPGFIHIDVTYLPKLEESKKYLYVAIDRATRLIHIKLMDKKTKECAVEFLNECMEFYPYKIQKVLTDNGFEFTNKRYNRGNKKPGIHDFTKQCKVNSIEHRTTQIKSPWTNGLVERLNRTIKDNTVHKYKYQSYKELEKGLNNYKNYYNLYRKHKSLQRKTPYQVTIEWFEKKPELFRYNPQLIIKGTTW
jgi:transposase-like protein